MKIDYKITEYFEKNNLFSNDVREGLKVKAISDSLSITGSSRDLIELADLLVNVALSQTKGAHLHIDELTLINNNSDFKEIIIEKISKD